jgi:hypothetical protein
MPERRNPFSSFADPNSFLGQPVIPAVGRALSQGAESIRRSEEEFRAGVTDAASRAMTGLGRTASTLGSAYMSPVFAAQQAVSGRPLIKAGATFGGVTRPEAPTPTTTVLPSGTPMVGFDSYPTAPQMTPRTASATAPQPAASTNVPTFPNVGMGIMGNQNVGPLPTEQFSPMARMAPTLADRGNVTTDITGMQGKVPIQTPYGTIYATAGQAQTQRVSEMGGLPAQSARLANIGEQARRMGMAKAGGRQIAQGYTETMRNFANQNINSPVNLPAPQGRFGQALVGNFPRSREATARAEQAVSPTSPLASLGSAPSFPFLEGRNRNPFSSIYGLQS